MAYQYDSSTDTYKLSFTELTTFLPSMSANTLSAPYNIQIIGGSQANFQGSQTAQSNTLQYVLQSNPTKYVNISFSSTIATEAIWYPSYLFYGCTSLVGVDITGIGYCSNGNAYDVSYMFGNCTNLKSFTATDNSDITKADYMFTGCTSLTSINIQNLYSINNASYMFNSCTGLTSVTFPAETKSYSNAEGMFYNCSALTTLNNLSYVNVTNGAKMFYRCLALTSITISNFTNVTSLLQAFFGCSKLTTVTAANLAKNSTSYQMFRGCTKLTTANVSGMSKVVDVGDMFYNCTSLTTVNVSGMTSVTDSSQMFYNCTEITTLDISSMTKIEYTKSMFENCSKLTSIGTCVFKSIYNCSKMFKGCSSLEYATVSGIENASDVSEMYSGCSNLACIDSLPYASTSSITYANIFNNVQNVWDIGIIKKKPSSSQAFIPSSVKSCGILLKSIANIDLTNNTGLKIYTTPSYYSALSNEIVSLYPNNNIQVTQIDACLDYNELEEWLSEQTQNTADTPYKVFIGGGLSSDKVVGTSGTDCSLLGEIISNSGKYVNLSSCQLPSDCTSLDYCFSDINNSIKVINTFEIESSVISLNYFAFYNQSIKKIGNTGLIPSSVLTTNNAFVACTNLEELRVEHQLTSSYNYKRLFGDISVSYNKLKFYLKDYTYYWREGIVSIYSPKIYAENNNKVILECDYSDLDTYLSWFGCSCPYVQLKITGLSEANLIGSGTASPFSASPLCSKLLGTNISNSTIKGYVAASNFDLRITEIPSTQTSLLGCFQNGNILYSFELPDTITNLRGTYAGCPLKESPILPSELTSLESTFAKTNLTAAPIIPSTITNMEGTFFDTPITVMPDIPNGVTTLEKAFYGTRITTTKTIPSTVTNMEECFSYCTYLEEVKNVPANVTTLQECFRGCSALETINNWEVDVRNVTMTNCFAGCNNLAEINTNATINKDTNNWRYYVVRNKTVDNEDIYELTVYDLKDKTETVLNVEKDLISSFITEELIFSSAGSITDEIADSFVEHPYPWKTKTTDIAIGEKNFIIQAADPSAVSQNIFDPSTLDIPTKTSQLTNDSGFITSSGSITGSSGSCTGNAATATTASSCSGNAATATKASTYSGNNTVISSASAQSAGVDRRFVVTSNVTLTLNYTSSTNGVIVEVFAVSACTVKYYTSSSATSSLSMAAGTRATFIFYNGWKYYGVYGAVWN